MGERCASGSQRGVQGEPGQELPMAGRVPMHTASRSWRPKWGHDGPGGRMVVYSLAVTAQSGQEAR